MKNCNCETHKRFNWFQKIFLKKIGEAGGNCFLIYWYDLLW